MQDSKRIAVNTLYLYIRMFIVLIIGLYTSRVILKVLGVQDYGIYNVVGGFVSMFGVISNSLSTAISRFLTFELGRHNVHQLNKVFSVSINIQVCIGVLILVIGEIVGVWFLNTHLNIPSARMVAANWVFQASLLSFCVSLLGVPYNACIMAHEKMNVFACFSIIEVVLKLLIVFLLFMSSFDSLILYAILLLIVTSLMLAMYIIYCYCNFKECRYRYFFDKNILRDLSGFASWNFVSSISTMLNFQGLDVISNMFFGVTVNAARGIASQVNNVLSMFVNNFMTAVNPQITKAYAVNDYDYMCQLVFRGAKFSFYLYSIIAIPLLFETRGILSLWLGNVPEFSVIFLRLIILVSLVNSIGNPLYTAIMATGKIRKYTIVINSFALLVFPITYVLFKFGFPAYISYIVFAIVYFCIIFFKLYFCKKMLGFNVLHFIGNVILKSFLLFMLALVIPMVLFNLLGESLLRMLILTIVSVFSSVLLIFAIGLDSKERNFVLDMVKAKIK